MSCYGPLVGYFSKELNQSGSRSIVFDKQSSFSGVPIRIPCGECIGCRMAWRRQWAVRCMHEKRLHRESAFLTLTYDDRHLPPHGSLVLRDLQLFMKRLRSVRPSGLRFFGCGEYGSVTFRPHYHVLLFNTSFYDQRFHKESPSGEPLYRSAELRGLWPDGDSDIGVVTARSCAYVAGYVTKKVGQAEWSDPLRIPEFRVMSRRPGIGRGWFDKFAGEAYRHDSAIMDEREVSLPRYYDSLYELIDPVALKSIKRERQALRWLHPEEQSRDRMAVKELLALKREEFFKRGG